MKKTKTIIFIAASAILLMGCSRGGGGAVNDGKLPSGGEETSLATSEGKELMKNRLNAVSEAYEGLDLDSVALTSTLSGFNVGLEANVEVKDIGKISIDAGVKNYGFKAEMKAAKDGKGVKASATTKTTGGNVSIKGSLPGKEQGKTAKIDASLSLSGVEENAYLANKNVYVDVSSNGNETFVKNTETFANKLIDQINDSMLGSLVPYYIQGYGLNEMGDVYDAKTGHFNLVSAYNKYLPEKKIALKNYANFEWPTISFDESKDEDSIDLSQISEGIQYLAEMKVDLNIVTYKNGAFGITASLDKESLKAIMRLTGLESDYYTAIVNMFTTVECNASAYFNKDNLLESVGFAYNCEAKMDKSFMKAMGVEEQALTAFDVKYSLKAEEKVAIKYGGIEVKLPDFSDYKEMSTYKY